MALLIAAMIVIAGCASPLVLQDDEALAVISYRVGDDGHILVDTMVNGEGPFQFALDTGASISVLFDRTRKAAGLALLENETVMVQGMVGSGDFPVVNVPALSVGSETWENARVVSLPANEPPLAQVDGILGVDFLRRYAVGLHAREHVVRLYAPASVSERSYLGWTSIPIQRLQVGTSDAAAYGIYLHIRAATIPAMLDLGSNANVMNWRAARAVGVLHRQPRKEEQLAGAVETAPITAELTVHELQVQDLFWRNRRFLIGDLQVFTVLGFDDRPMAIVGLEFFEERDLVIDFLRGRLLVRTARS